MIYILANANATSGGPELLHQLCYKLNKKGFCASMVYFDKWRFPAKGPSDNVSNKYSKYLISQPTTKLSKGSGDVIIIPETTTFFIPKFKKCKVILWWMSVDNYFASLDTAYAKYYSHFMIHSKKYDPFLNNHIIHAVQSKYAFDFLISKGVSKERIIYLSDFISKEFFEKSKNETNVIKDNNVLYNPKKGLEFTKKIINHSNFNWVPLINMTHDQMIETMTKSKVYIDFGNHPGKDRIPREAATCGCLILTNKKGSAANNQDIRIPEQYKFDDIDDNIEPIVDKIQDLLNNYWVRRDDYKEYRDYILSEENIFDKEIDEMCKKVGLSKQGL